MNRVVVDRLGQSYHGVMKTWTYQKFNDRGASHSVPPDTLVFHGIRVSANLLQQVAIKVARRSSAKTTRC
jgi:hypothetical protein